MDVIKRTLGKQYYNAEMSHLQIDSRENNEKHPENPEVSMDVPSLDTLQGYEVAKKKLKKKKKCWRPVDGNYCSDNVSMQGGHSHIEAEFQASLMSNKFKKKESDIKKKDKHKECSNMNAFSSINDSCNYENPASISNELQTLPQENISHKIKKKKSTFNVKDSSTQEDIMLEKANEGCPSYSKNIPVCTGDEQKALLLDNINYKKKKKKSLINVKDSSTHKDMMSEKANEACSINFKDTPVCTSNNEQALLFENISHKKKKKSTMIVKDSSTHQDMICSELEKTNKACPKYSKYTPGSTSNEQEALPLQRISCKKKKKKSLIKVSPTNEDIPCSQSEETYIVGPNHSEHIPGSSVNAVLSSERNIYDFHQRETFEANVSKQAKPKLTTEEEEESVSFKKRRREEKKEKKQIQKENYLLNETEWKIESINTKFSESVRAKEKGKKKKNMPSDVNKNEEEKITGGQMISPIHREGEKETQATASNEEKIIMQNFYGKEKEFVRKQGKKKHFKREFKNTINDAQFFNYKQKTPDTCSSHQDSSDNKILIQLEGKEYKGKEKAMNTSTDHHSLELDIPVQKAKYGQFVLVERHMDNSCTRTTEDDDNSLHAIGLKQKKRKKSKRVVAVDCEELSKNERRKKESELNDERREAACVLFKSDDAPQQRKKKRNRIAPESEVVSPSKQNEIKDLKSDFTDFCVADVSLSETETVSARKKRKLCSDQELCEFDLSSKERRSDIKGDGNQSSKESQEDIFGSCTTQQENASQEHIIDIKKNGRAHSPSPLNYFSDVCPEGRVKRSHKRLQNKQKDNKKPIQVEGVPTFLLERVCVNQEEAHIGISSDSPSEDLMWFRASRDSNGSFTQTPENVAVPSSFNQGSLSTLWSKERENRLSPIKSHSPPIPDCADKRSASETDDYSDSGTFQLSEEPFVPGRSNLRGLTQKFKTDMQPQQENECSNASSNETEECGLNTNLTIKQPLDKSRKSKRNVASNSKNKLKLKGSVAALPGIPNGVSKTGHLLFKCPTCCRSYRERTYPSHSCAKTRATCEKFFKCPACERTYSQNCHLKHHVRTFHMNLKLYKCSVCDRQFGEKQTLRSHCETQHSSMYSLPDPLQCRICEEQFLNTFALHRHYERKHHLWREFYCKFCPCSYFYIEDLEVHLSCIHWRKFTDDD